MKNKFIAAAIAAFLATGTAAAAPLSGQSGTGVPLVPGATETITFDSGSYTGNRLSIGGVTFVGVDGQFNITNSYAGQYNSRGTHYLDNNGGGTNTLRFDFNVGIIGFAFNFGASDSIWQLSAFDGSNNLIESVLAPVTNGGNAGDYIGLQNAGMTYATLTNLTGADWAFVDNFTIAEAGAADVPEPGSAALLGLGLMGLVAARRRGAKNRAG